MALQDLIKKRIDRLESVPENLKTIIDRENERLFKRVLEQLNRLEVKEGKIVTSKSNLAIIASIIDELKGTLFGGEYVEAIKQFAIEIETQAKLNNQILSATVGSFDDNELYRNTILKAQQNALLLMDENAVSSNFLQPLQELLTTATISGISYTDAVEMLRSNMVGENAIFSKYAGQIVKDTFAVSDRQYVQLTARLHGIEFYKYDGGKVEDTREFCLERAGKVFHEKEIEAWGNFKKTRPEFIRPKYLYETKAGVKIYWEGMNYDTNSATIKSYAGGYNCLHVLVPIATEYVSSTDKARAKELGFFAG